MSFQKLISIFILALTLFSFCNCGNAKPDGESIQFQQNPPFLIEGVTAQKWMAGIQEGGTGTNLVVPVSHIKEGVVFKDLYFRDQVIEAKTDPSIRVRYNGYFKDEKKDFVMDSDYVTEAQNTPRTPFPFDLTVNEAVFSYAYQNKEFYYKITGVIDLEPLFLPSVNPNGID
ncbi:MAG: hypothetical protein ACI825_000351 [Planctomycetota bacterium]|jgi:hypothetical protein|uniref:hypothetical protein n=1 Tax=Patiriisocius sp. Uisw_047 TaxID=3230969 RepID=UPI0039E89886